VKRKWDLSLIKDWRVAGSAGVLAGFLVGLLVFGRPWGLPADWGDIPTWLLVLLGAVAGWAALDQLRILQGQVKEEVERNAQRDKLIDEQLKEAEARAVSEQRRQAEGVELRFRGSVAFVLNQSPRPVFDIACSVMSRAALDIVARADKAGAAFDAIVAPHPPGTEQLELVPPESGWRWAALRPRASCGFIFEGLATAEDHVTVVWFTDDAGLRWQLDGNMHDVR
jgi:hypothetical protein